MILATNSSKDDANVESVGDAAAATEVSVILATNSSKDNTNVESVGDYAAAAEDADDKDEEGDDDFQEMLAFRSSGLWFII